MWDPVNLETTYLRADEKETLLGSPFIGRDNVIPGQGLSVQGNSTMQGVTLSPDGEPVEGIRVSLVGEDFWNWGEAGEDGTFAMGLPEGAAGSFILNIHAGVLGNCGRLGYFGPDGFTVLRGGATQFEVGSADSTDVEIRLPVNVDELCSEATAVTGVVLGSDGNPLQWIELSAFGEWFFTGPDGAFAIPVPEGWTGPYSVRINVSSVAECGVVGYYGTGGFTTLVEDAEIAGGGATGIEIRLPVDPDELCRRQGIVFGAVLGPDGQPVEGTALLLESFGEWGETGPDGTFEIRLLEGLSGSSFLSIYVSDCVGPVGHYGPGGFTTPWPDGSAGENATLVEVGGGDGTGIEIRLPADPSELCN